MSFIAGNNLISSKDLSFAIDAENPSLPLTEVEVLVVAGGGGGGYQMGGGGGAGGLIYKPSYPVSSGNITITVGNGGPGRISNTDTAGQGVDSSFGVLVAKGGGAGGNNSSSAGPTNGGSGGGTGEGTNFGSGTVGQGNRGGRAIELGYYHSGGGGGAGGKGRDGHINGGGNGGPGLKFTIEGYERYYAGGGGGGVYSPAGGKRYPGEGGVGGGGDAGWFYLGKDGKANTGGGGGGGSYDGSNSYNGGSGGSGIVVVRYPGPRKATGGNTIVERDGHTIHTFTSDGTFTQLTSPETLGVDDISGNNRPQAVVDPNSLGNLTTVDGIRCWNCSSGGKELRHYEANRLLLGDSYTLIAVTRALTDDDVNTWRTLWRCSPDDHPLIIQDGTDIIGHYENGGANFVSYGVTLASTGAGGNWAVWSIVAENGGSSLYINGSLINSIPYNSRGNSLYQIGNHFSQPFGYVASAYVYKNRALTADEIAENAATLRRRYGF